MGVRQYPIVAKFGIMHLMCANLCVWMAATINKTADQFHASRLYSQYNASANAVTGAFGTYGTFGNVAQFIVFIMNGSSMLSKRLFYL